MSMGMGMKLDVLDVDGYGEYADSVHLHLVHVQADRPDGDPRVMIRRSRRPRPPGWKRSPPF